MINLYQKYGYCIIPKGTLLFRGGSTTTMETCKFFTLSKYEAAVWVNTRQRKLQIWEALADVKILFMVDYIHQMHNVKSAIVDIYERFFPDDRGHNNLGVKHFDHQKRNALINALRAEDIFGWFSSLEDKVAVEVCLFSDKAAFEQEFVLIDAISEKDISSHSDYNNVNSLYNINVFPGNNFFTKTKDKLKSKPFSEYKAYQKACIEHEVESYGSTYADFERKYYDLRMKLEV